MEGPKSQAAIALTELLTQIWHMGYHFVAYRDINWGTVAIFDILSLSREIHPPRVGGQPTQGVKKSKKNCSDFFGFFTEFA